MTPQELFEQAFFIGMVAETGHFHVKNEAYHDFKDGGRSGKRRNDDLRCDR
jgi:hypothetical protein